MHTDRQIVTSRLLDAPRALVFAAFTDPRHISNWWGPRGFRTTTHEMDVRTGGVWRFIMHGPDGTDYRNRIRYTEVIPNERLAYDHDDDGENNMQPFQGLITFADEAGKTRVTLSLTLCSVAERENMVKFGAVEGAQQTLQRLSEHTLVNTPGAFVLTRDLEAPRELVFKAWTEPERLAHWFGPKGFKLTVKTGDIRTGGLLHASMEAPNGMKMWAKWLVHEVSPLDCLVFTNCFSDEYGGLGRHPAAPQWPQQTLSVIEFEEVGENATRLTIRGILVHATADEHTVFASNHASMRGGWGGTLEQLTAYLADETQTARA